MDKATTINGYEVYALKPHDLKEFGNAFHRGRINHPIHKWGIWNYQGKARQIKGFKGKDLSLFDLDLQ